MTDVIEIPGGTGRALVLRQGEALKIVNTHGTQVVDTWALALADTGEYLSVEHTRRMLFGLFPERGKPLWSNRRTEMLVLEPAVPLTQRRRASQSACQEAASVTSIPPPGHGATVPSRGAACSSRCRAARPAAERLHVR